MKHTWILGTLIILLVWFLITAIGLIDRVFLPYPVDVFKSLYTSFISTAILKDIFDTLWRTISGFLIGGTIGIIIGLIMGSFRPIYETMEFPVDFFRSIPATALFPLFIVIWGLGDQVKIFIAAWASSMVLLINTIYGIRSVSGTRLMVAKIKKTSQIKTFYKVVIPEAIPYIIAGARIGLSLALVVEIVAEMFLGSHSGLGRRIFNATSIFEMEEAYASVFVVGILGYLMNKIIILIEMRLVHWSGK